MKIQLCSSLLLGVMSAGSSMAPAANQPNFIVILLDDVGYSDFSCYGGEMPTPNIDSLAAQGIRFTQFYNGARSCPTRASLLTGLYPHQTGVGHMASTDYAAEGGEAYQGYLNDKCVTFAEALRDHGYFTAFSGKWHVGGRAETIPHNRGFLQSISASAGGFYFPNSSNVTLSIDGARIQPTDSRLPANWYSTDLWTSFALKYVDQSIGVDKPFLIYLAHNAAHFPLQAPQEDIEKWRGKFRKGWDVLRQERYERQLKMNLFGQPYPLTPRNPSIPLWESLSPEQKDKSDHLMAIYAAVIDRLDQSIGRLVRELKQKGVFDNTFIILLSDNGGNAEGTMFGRYNGAKPGDASSDIWIGQAWGELANTPFFLYKHHTHEGGIATPCIVSFPAYIPGSLKGSLQHQPAHILDVMPTLLQLSGARYPTVYRGNPIPEYEGASITPLLKGQPLNRTKPLFWEHENNFALRVGNWKLVKEREETNWQLYNIQKDRTEMQDQSSCFPEKTSEMKTQLQLISNRIGVKTLNFPSNNWMTPIVRY